MVPFYFYEIATAADGFGFDEDKRIGGLLRLRMASASMTTRGLAESMKLLWLRMASASMTTRGSAEL
jgi:hypothetical protein